MLKRLIGTLGLFAIMIWVCICGGGYILDFFGVLELGWFSEEWLIGHPIIDLSLLVLVIVGTFYIMGVLYDLMNMSSEPEEIGQS